MLLLLLIAVLIAGVQAQSYTVPEPRLEALWPTGIRVSIPDSPGVELFAFHGSVNKPLRYLGAGDMSRDILSSRDGRWVFEDPSVQLKVGDVLYYWLYVQVHRRGYQRTNLYWIVDSYVSDSPGVVPVPAAGYSVPEARVEALHPRGLRVSIPDSPGIKLFAFHGNVNQPMYSLDAGTMSKDIVMTRDGRWVFEDPDVMLKPGDVIYYWTYVIREGLGYRRDNQKFVVSALLGEPVEAVTEPERPQTPGKPGHPGRPEFAGKPESPGKPTPPGKPGSPDKEYAEPCAPSSEPEEVKLPEGLEFKVTVKDGKLQLTPIVPELDRRMLTKRLAEPRA